MSGGLKLDVDSAYSTEFCRHSQSYALICKADKSCLSFKYNQRALKDWKKMRLEIFLAKFLFLDSFQTAIQRLPRYPQRFCSL